MLFPIICQYYLRKCSINFRIILSSFVETQLSCIDMKKRRVPDFNFTKFLDFSGEKNVFVKVLNFSTGFFTRFHLFGKDKNIAKTMLK